MQRNASLARYLNPWKFKRELEREQRVAELRGRDGDQCRRCRRPIRFDLPEGRDQAPKVEQMIRVADGEALELQHLFLCHARCNAQGVDHTPEVTERARRKNEAELFSNRHA